MSAASTQGTEAGAEATPPEASAEATPPVEGADAAAEKAEVEKALEDTLRSVMERATSAYNEVKGGKKATPRTYAMLAGMERDIKGLRDKYPSPKVAKEFTNEEFEKFVAEESVAVTEEQDPAVQKLRSEALGESIVEFRKKMAVLPTNARDQSKVTVSIYADPWKHKGPTAAVTPSTQPAPSPGKPGNAFPGQTGSQPMHKADDGEAAPAAKTSPADDAEVWKDDDGKWPSDMAEGAESKNILVAFGKNRPRDTTASPGMLGDIAGTPEPAEAPAAAPDAAAAPAPDAK